MHQLKPTLAIVLVLAAAWPGRESRALPPEGGEEKCRVSQAVLLPEAVASFGAAASGGWLYVYGGHTGRAHQHSRENLSRSFRRLNLLDRASWEELPGGPPLQGVCLVARDSLLYRVGGLSARNARSEPEDLHSVADFSSYDPLSSRWQDLPPLPEPRSSHEAVVTGSTLYVLGGWSIQGDDKRWHPNGLKLDLSQSEPRWQEIAGPPTRRRALAAGALGRRIVVLGGITPEGAFPKSVEVYDPETGSWSAGPDFPGDGFGAAAAGLNGKLLASGRDGTIHALSEDAARWETAATLCFPRFFHRLAPLGSNELLVAGGAGQGSHLRSIETVALDARGAGSEAVRVTVPFPGKAKNRQAVFISGDDLYLAGGNTSLKQHDFGPENFVAEAFRVRLGSLEIARLPDLPVKRQSMEALVMGKSSSAPGSALLAGGFGHDGEVARSHDQAMVFPLKAGAWNLLEARLPAPRTQFGMVAYGDAVWIFGGLDYNPRRSEESFRYPREVLRIQGGPPAITAAPHEVPRHRRAFASAVLADRCYLVGGMRERFEAVEECDVFDFASSKWETIPSPARPRVSPDLAALGGKLYLAGGMSPKPGGGLEPNGTLECYDPAQGKWSVLLDPLPFSPGVFRMLPFRDRLLFFSTHELEEPALRLMFLKPGSVPAP